MAHQNGSFPRITYQQQLQLLQQQQQQVLIQQQHHLQQRHQRQQQQQQQLEQHPRVSTNIIGNGHVAGPQNQRLSLTPCSTRLHSDPKQDHKPDNYEDLQLGFDPRVFSSLEQYMPPDMLNKPRDVKAQYMSSILMRYSSEGDRVRIQKHKEYRQKIMSTYQPLYKEIYTMDAENFFVPSFLDAIRENTEAGFRRILAEPTRGIYTFEMLQPEFCEMLVSEFSLLNSVDALWTLIMDLLLNMGSTGIENLVGFEAQYSCFHIDDSEVTLNICLGKEFSGGELFFRGARCDAHVNSDSQLEEIFDYSHVPGQAILHSGRHRHGAKATVSGKRMNLILWCRSSTFREMIKYQRAFAGWCGECRRKKKERERLSIAATKQELLKRRMAL
nr:uncharacterized PKHD-type hydroxylase At1g22950 isoform X2 [Arachis hypogaea]